MKIAQYMIALSTVVLTACSSTTTAKPPAPAKQQDPRQLPETVMVTYHLKPGTEDVFQDALARAWGIYRKEHLVFAEPHTIVLEGDGVGKSRIIEIFTWVSHTAPERAGESVKQVWAEMHSLCQARDGHGGLEGGEVVLLAPKSR